MAAAASPWGHLLGQPVPDLRTKDAHLVVAGRRVATPSEVLAALGMQSMRNGPDADPDDDSITESDVQLARRYCARLQEMGAKVDPADLAQAQAAAQASRKGGRPRKDASAEADRNRRNALRYYAANRDAILKRQRARQREKARQRREAQEARSVSEQLAAIDADATLTAKQRADRKYALMHRDRLNDTRRAKYAETRERLCDEMGVRPARLSVPCSPEPAEEQTPCA